MARLLKTCPMADERVPSFVRARARNLMIYYHKRWVEKGEVERESYEENAIQAMSEDSYLRDYYLGYLCDKQLQEQAVHFVMALGMKVGECPERLREYWKEHSEEVARVSRKFETKRKGGGSKEVMGEKDSRFEVVSWEF